MKTKIVGLFLASVACCFVPLTAVYASSTAFTYQGRLNDGVAPASGTYDLTFALFAESTGVTPVGNTLTNSALAVSNGLFIANLDFGGGNFTGQPLWLRIGARTNGGGNFTLLSPLQQLTPAPSAIYSLNAGSATSAGFATTAGSATSLSGTLSPTQLSGTIPLAKLPASVVLNNASGVTLNGSFSGDGSGLANVNSIINNTTTNPIPVSVPVPLPIYNVDNPGRQPITFATNVFFGGLHPLAVRNFNFVTVPNDRRFVIESISVSVGLSSISYVDIPTQYLPPSNTNQYQILLQTTLMPPLYTNGTQIYYQSNSIYSGFTLPPAIGQNLPTLTQMVKLYADASSTVSVSCFSSAIPSQENLSFYVSLSGYYIFLTPPAITQETPPQPPTGTTSSPP